MCMNALRGAFNLREFFLMLGVTALVPLIAVGGAPAKEMELENAHWTVVPGLDGLGTVQFRTAPGGVPYALPLLQPLGFRIMTDGLPLQPMDEGIGERHGVDRVTASGKMARTGTTETMAHCRTDTELLSDTLVLRTTVTLTTGCETEPEGSGLLMRLSWEREGYNTTDPLTCTFSAFYSEDSGHYIPVEQLKRMHARTNALTGKRLVLVGNEGYDLVVESECGSPLRLHWLMKQDSIQFRFFPFEVLPKVKRPKAGEELSFGVRLQVRPRNDLPSYYPRFMTSAGSIDQDLTSFYIERSHSWTMAMSDWFAWIAPIHSWHGSPLRQRLLEQLRTWPQDEDGYVWTWINHRGWPFPPVEPDSHHYLANSTYVLASRDISFWTVDAGFEEAAFRRSVKAVDYFRNGFGRSGRTLVLDTDGHRGRNGEWSSNFYDLHPFGYRDGYTNIYYYAALMALAEWSETRNERGKGLQLRATADQVRQEYNELFWNEERGRYIGWIDADGAKHDYGYVFLNLEALYYGLGDEQKARRIFEWLENEPTDSGEADVFSAFVFAPRLTTRHSTDWLTGLWPPHVPYGTQCQNGGTWLHVMYYELAVRARYFGVENCYARFAQLMERYSAGDRLCGGPPLIHGEVPQLSYRGHDPSGSVGVDEPFPESGLAPSVFVHVFAGARADGSGLTFQPQLPKVWEWIEIRNMNYGGTRLDVRLYADEAWITFPDDAKQGVEIRRKAENGAIRFLRSELRIGGTE